VRGYIQVFSKSFGFISVAMADQEELKVTKEKAPEKSEQQETPVEENEFADKSSEEPAKEMRAVVFTGIGGLQYVNPYPANVEYRVGS
jgi:hypothetical protein